MEQEKFVQYMERQGVKVSALLYGVSWGARQRMAALTEFVDFGCDGGCKRNPDESMRCCNSCFGSGGHFGNSDRVIPKKDLAEMAKLFDSTEHKDKNESHGRKWGFWSPNGCVLRRELRSTLCLTHYCIGNHKISSRAEELVQILRWLHTPIDCIKDWLIGEEEGRLGKTRRARNKARHELSDRDKDHTNAKAFHTRIKSRL